MRNVDALKCTKRITCDTISEDNNNNRLSNDWDAGCMILSNGDHFSVFFFCLSPACIETNATSSSFLIFTPTAASPSAAHSTVGINFGNEDCQFQALSSAQSSCSCRLHAYRRSPALCLIYDVLVFNNSSSAIGKTKMRQRVANNRN